MSNPRFVQKGTPMTLGLKGVCRWMAILGALLLASQASAGEAPALETQKDKTSYSLGYQFGQSMKAQGVELNLEVYTSGIQDALSGTNARLSQDEIRNAVNELQKGIAAARQKQFQEIGDKNLALGNAFLEENKKKEGVVSLPSGLQYKVLADGSGKKPNAADEVTVNYRGSFIDGTEIDSTYRRGQPATVKVGSVIRGWTEALLLMKEGSRWHLFVPPALAYGEQGAGPVQPNSTLIFEVELLSIK
jgi:FKBP-type peptidyl-prolyl cis-trans isomerase